ncbi:splicing factor [Tanacetum coccineum]
MKNISITVHHEGTFAYDPLVYEYSDVDVVENVNLENCNYERLMQIVRECCLFPIHAEGVTEEVIEQYTTRSGMDSKMAKLVIIHILCEEDVEISKTILNDTFLNKLLDGKFISDKDFGAKLDTKSNSLRKAKVEDTSVDDIFKVKEGLPWNEMEPLLGMKFEHPDQLKDCLINYGVTNGYQLWYRRNDYRNISILCGKNMKEGRCASQKGKQKVVEDIGTPNSKSKHSISYAKSPKSPKTPKSKQSTSKKSQSPKTPKSPNATPNDDAAQKSSMKEGWRGSCRRVIGLDGCFLKSTCRCELLTAMGRDANNQMFPMAWAVVSIENSKNWLWFLSNLSNDFNLGMGAYLTILSDGHKGLIEAVKELLPHVEHRLCARHIYANFKRKWNGLHYKSLFWGAAASILKVQFKHKIELIKDIDPLAFDWLMERDPKTWCRTYFQMDWSCAAFENGISESYHSAIGFARTKPIITMLEEIREFEVRKADEGFGWLHCMLNQDSGIRVNSANPPPLPPKKRIMPGRPRKNMIKHVTKGVNQVSRAGEVLPTLAYEIKQQEKLGARISHSLKIYLLISKHHQSS